MNRKSSMETCTVPCVKRPARGNLPCDAGSSPPRSVTAGRGRRWEEAREGGDTCIPVADACCCVAETNTIL